MSLLTPRNFLACLRHAICNPSKYSVYAMQCGIHVMRVKYSLFHRDMTTSKVPVTIGPGLDAVLFMNRT